MYVRTHAQTHKIHLTLPHAAMDELGMHTYMHTYIHTYMTLSHAAIDELGYRGTLQLATFHPQYQFAGTDEV
jgi:hypothetical protein